VCLNNDGTIYYTFEPVGGSGADVDMKFLPHSTSNKVDFRIYNNSRLDTIDVSRTGNNVCFDYHVMDKEPVKGCCELVNGGCKTNTISAYQDGNCIHFQTFDDSLSGVTCSDGDVWLLFDETVIQGSELVFTFY
jgi:hypothetical protein